MKEKLLNHVKQKSKQAKFYNQNTKELPPLQTGEVVRIAPKPGDRELKWFKAQVEDQVDIRSYEEQKTVDCTGETVDTSASLRNHLFRLLKPV